MAKNKRPGVIIPDTLSTPDSNDKFPIVKDLDFGGGYRAITSSSFEERNSIPPERRSIGMRVLVVISGKDSEGNTKKKLFDCILLSDNGGEKTTNSDWLTVAMTKSQAYDHDNPLNDTLPDNYEDPESAEKNGVDDSMMLYYATDKDIQNIFKG